MTISSVYKCDICGTTYKDKTSCEECELFHVRFTRVEIIGKRYLPKNNSHIPYPDQITVRTAEGCKILYVYKENLGKG